MSEDVFCFVKHNPIVIYGSNKTGINYYQQLIIEGYDVQCFIDIKAKEQNGVCIIDEKEVPIYMPSEMSQLDSEVIIVIAVRNVVEQNNIAKKLWQNNFQNVVYFPLIKESRYNIKFLNCLKLFYRDFIDGNIREDILPKQKVLWEIESFYDHAIVTRSGEYITAWIPISLIHYYDEQQHVEMEQKLGRTVDHDLVEREWCADKSIFQIEWLTDLFNFFINGQGDLIRYWEIEKGVDNYIKQQSMKENQLWFSDRQKCADLLMSGLNMGTDFMLQSAIPVKWNEKGYFNICDGAHRLSFMNCLNMSMVLVQTTQEDYQSWIHMDALTPFLEYLQEKNVTVFETPIPHPWFYGFEVKEEKFGKTILKCILEQMMQLKIYKDFSVLDINPMEGYYLQHFARINASVVTGIVHDKDQADFLSFMNKLFYLGDRINLVGMETERDNGKKYDIVLIMKMLCELDEKAQVRYIKWISSKTKRLIIWESGVEYEQEKQMILQNSLFRRYVFLKRVLSDNVVREVGIFLKIAE